MKKYHLALTLAAMFIFCSSLLRSQVIDYSLVCLDSVWYDPGNPQFINVSVFNGNADHLNYPSVQIVSPAGDTIGNPSNRVNFFAHLGNTYQTYTDTITIPGITDFSTCTFLVSEGFGDTTVAISWCNTNGIVAIPDLSYFFFPNPAGERVYIYTLRENEQSIVSIYNSLGVVKAHALISNVNGSSIDISYLPAGIYFVELTVGKNVITRKLIKH